MALFEKIDTVIVRVQDIQKAKAWYQDVLELTLTYEQETGDKIVVFQVNEGGTPITIYELKQGEATPERGGTASSYPIFFVHNAADVHAQLLARGVDCGDIHVDGSSSFFTFQDLDGNTLEVCAF